MGEIVGNGRCPNPGDVEDAQSTGTRVNSVRSDSPSTRCVLRLSKLSIGKDIGEYAP